MHEPAAMPQSLTALPASVAESKRLLALSADIGTALAGSDSLRMVLGRCADAIVQHLNALLVRIWTLKPEESMLELQANAGVYAHGAPRQIGVDESNAGLIVRQRQPYLTDSIADAPELAPCRWHSDAQRIAFAGYPLVVEDRLVGVIVIYAGAPFPASTRSVLAWTASSIAVGIDRIRMSDALADSIAKMVHMNQNLRRKNAELDEFTYVASHDLIEPLRKLIAFSTMLRKDLGTRLPERAEHDLRFIVEAAARMQTLVHKLLELSRAGNAAMKWDWVPLEACADQALEALTERVQTTHATINRHPLPTVRGDQAMLTQLYQNLLSNALKFTGDRRPVVDLTAQWQEREWVLGVKDNGIGIQAAYHQQVFRPFTRLHGRGAYEGTGIGLAICYKTVERHGGRIWVESEPGHGAHFRFTLGGMEDDYPAPPSLSPRQQGDGI